MKAAIIRAADGKVTRLPPRVMYHVIAARYGQTPDQVRAWPADDYLDAIQMLPVTSRG